MPRLTKAELHSILHQAAVPNGGPLWTRVSPDVDWLVIGSGPGCGHYHGLKELRANTLERLIKHIDGDLNLKVVNVIVGDDAEWTTLELEARGKLKNGGDYFNRYALTMRWNDEGQVVQVRDYLDTAMVKSVFDNSDVF